MIEKIVRVIVFNATFNNISVISRWTVLLVEETGVPGENYLPVVSHRQLNACFIFGVMTTGEEIEIDEEKELSIVVGGQRSETDL